MMHTSNTQERSSRAHEENQSEQQFDQWAKAVRQQMIAALKRRGNL